MASSVFLLCTLIIGGFLSVLCTDKSTEQTGLYFIDQPKDVVALKNKPLLLPCSAKSTKDEKLKLIWIHDGNHILPDVRRQILANGSLSFTKVMHKKNGYSDQGEYRCVVTDGNGFLSSMYMYLRIAGLQNFTEHPKSQIVREKSHVRMSCQIDSLPDADISWEHNDEILPESSSTHRILSGPGINGSIIYIFNVGIENSGKYRCIATNPMTQNQRLSKRAILTVKDMEKEDVPKFLSPPQTKIVKEGDHVQLDCVVNGFPFPTLTWAYQRKGTTDGVQVFNSTMTGFNFPYIEKITLEQSGYYTCSMLGDPVKEIVVTVKVMTHPQFIERPETVTYQAARAVRFRCKVIGNPVPVIIWVKDGSPINITGRITHNTKINATIGLRTSEILVASSLASDSGIYQCMAKNPVGMIWSASRLILNATKPAPRPPENVSCHTISSTEIRVDWLVHPDMLIGGLKAFTIHYHDIDGGEELRDAVLPTNRSINVRSLVPYTNYTFYLRSYSDSASDFSKQVICQTGEEVPEAAPEIQLLSSTSQSMEISWSPLTKKQARGKIVKYKIQWRINRTPSTNVHRVNGNILKYTITDLLPNTEYEVRVLAATSKGWPSANFPWKSFRLPEASQSEYLPEPNLMLQALNSSAVKVTWSIRSDFHNQLRGFILFYQKENGKSENPIAIQTSVSEYYITELDPDTLYEIELRVLTDKDEGKSVRKSIRTLPMDSLYKNNYPGNSPLIEPPFGLEAKPSSRGVISLSWNVPPSAIKNIKDYTVCYNPVQTSLTASKSSINCFKSSETEVLIPNLEPYTLYEFRVKSNGIGDVYSDYSQSVECYTFEDVPSQVMDIRWKPENKTTIFVQWKKPRKSNGVILNYTISYTTDASSPLQSWSTKVVSGHTLYSHVTDLIPNTEYSMIIRASTSAGLGAYGSPRKVTIPVLMGGISKKTPKSSKDRRNEQYVGIIVGLGIGLTCIIICTLCIVCRRRCVKNQAAAEMEPPSGRGTNGTACFAERERRLDTEETGFFSYHSARGARCENSSLEQNLDKKGLCSNGFPNGMRMTLLGEGKSSNTTANKENINVTENSRYDVTGAVSPLLGHQHSTLNVSSDNGYDRDLSFDSDLNHSKVPLLKGKRKFSETEQMTHSNSEDSESEREGKDRPSTVSNSVLEALGSNNDSISEKDIKSSGERGALSLCLLRDLTVTISLKNNGELTAHPKWSIYLRDATCGKNIAHEEKSHLKQTISGTLTPLQEKKSQGQEKIQKEEEMKKLNTPSSKDTQPENIMFYASKTKKEELERYQDCSWFQNESNKGDLTSKLSQAEVLISPYTQVNELDLEMQFAMRDIPPWGDEYLEVFDDEDLHYGLDEKFGEKENLIYPSCENSYINYKLGEGGLSDISNCNNCSIKKTDSYDNMKAITSTSLSDIIPISYQEQVNNVSYHVQPFGGKIKNEVKEELPVDSPDSNNYIIESEDCDLNIGREEEIEVDVNENTFEEKPDRPLPNKSNSDVELTAPVNGTIFGISTVKMDTPEFHISNYDVNNVVEAQERVTEHGLKQDVVEEIPYTLESKKGEMKLGLAKNIFEQSLNLPTPELDFMDLVNYINNEIHPNPVDSSPTLSFEQPVTLNINMPLKESSPNMVTMSASKYSAHYPSQENISSAGMETFAKPAPYESLKSDMGRNRETSSDLNTVNPEEVQDSISIAERIKIGSRRKRSRRYSLENFQPSDDAESNEDDVSEYEDDYEMPRKRVCRSRSRNSDTASSKSGGEAKFEPDSYRERRDKNNAASRRSRQNKKDKERQMYKCREEAERKNLVLRTKADKLEKLVTYLRQMLLQVVLKKRSGT